MDGGQTQRAAASALGNIMFSWLVAQDMHQTGRLPQPSDSRPVPKPGIPGERIRRKGSLLPRPYAWFSFPDHASPSPGLIPTAPGNGFPHLPNCTHLLAQSQKAREEKLKAQVLWENTRTFALSEAPFRASISRYYGSEEGGGARRRMGLG